MQEEPVTDTDRPVKAKKVKKSLVPVNVEENSGGNCKFARALGSVDWHTREQGLQALTLWLTRNTPSEADLTKIWKAVFFCFWHSDKAHVQAQLAERLAAILPMMNAEAALLYFKVFVKTMQREWFGIDRLRLDKFMMLARKFLHQLFVHLQDSVWDSGRTTAYCTFLSDDVFMRSDREPSAGFSLHLADIAIPELCAACKETGSVPAEALQALLEPFCRAAAHTKRPALLARLQDGVFGELLQAGSAGALANLDMRSLGTKLFDLGAQPEVRARNREVLYALSKLFERAAAKRAKKSHEAAPSPAALDSSAPSISAPAEMATAPRSQKGSEPPQKQKQKKLKIAKAQPASGPGRLERDDPSEAASLATPSPSAAAAAAAAAKAAATVPAHSAERKQHEASSGKGKAPKPLQGSRNKETPEVLTPAAPSGSEPGPLQNGQPGAEQVTSKKRKKSMAALVAEAAALKARRAPGGAVVSGEILAASVAGGLAERAASAAPSTPTVPASEASPAAAPQLTASQRKKVKFSMKNNLYFEKGGPVPPAEIRTPPTAKPKGSALKRVSSVAPRPKSPKCPRSQGTAAGVLGKKRARAALFFKS